MKVPFTIKHTLKEIKHGFSATYRITKTFAKIELCITPTPGIKKYFNQDGDLRINWNKLEYSVQSITVNTPHFTLTYIT